MLTLNIKTVMFMSLRIRVIIYGPPKSGKSLFLRKIYELYRDASMHEIRHFGGGSASGVDYCTFQIGDIIYEFYAPPGASTLRVFREKLIKNADAVIFIIPMAKAHLDRTASFLLELKRALFTKFGPEADKFPVIYAPNSTRRIFSMDIESSDLVDILRLPSDSIIRPLDLDNELSVRRIFGLVIHLSLLWHVDRKQYFVEFDREVNITKNLYFKEVAIPPEEALAQIVELMRAEAGKIGGEAFSKEMLLGFPDALKNKLLRNYVNEVVLVGFDRTIGFIPLGYAFGLGKVIDYIKDPARVVELSIIVKHSMGFLLSDGFTFLGLIPFKDQGFLILETTSSHIKKMINLVKSLKKKMSTLTTGDTKRIMEILDRVLT